MTMLVLGTLTLSAAAAYFFLGNTKQDPLVIKFFAYQAEIDKHMPAARAGSANAQFAVAETARKADSAFRNYNRIMAWYRKSADQGHIGAQYALGRLHEIGEGTSQDYRRAAEWYRLAAGLGRHQGAQFALGSLYFYGRGVPHSYGEATNWYRKSAERGHPVAQYLLGLMFKEGWGVDRDLVEALKWMTLAKPNFDRVKAYDRQRNPVRDREKILAAMNNSQIEQAKKRVDAWKPQR